MIFLNLKYNYSIAFAASFGFIVFVLSSSWAFVFDAVDFDHKGNNSKCTHACKSKDPRNKCKLSVKICINRLSLIILCSFASQINVIANLLISHIWFDVSLHLFFVNFEKIWFEWVCWAPSYTSASHWCLKSCTFFMALFDKLNDVVFIDWLECAIWVCLTIFGNIEKTWFGRQSEWFGKAWIFCFIDICKLNFAIELFGCILKHILEGITVVHWICDENNKPRSIRKKFSCWVIYQFLIIYLCGQIYHLFLNRFDFRINRMLPKFEVTYFWRWLLLFISLDIQQ